MPHPAKHPKCKCGHSREAHDLFQPNTHAPGECTAFIDGAVECPCPWYTPEDRSPQPARVGGSSET